MKYTLRCRPVGKQIPDNILSIYFIHGFGSAPSAEPCHNYPVLILAPSPQSPGPNKAI